MTPKPANGRSGTKSLPGSKVSRATGIAIAALIAVVVAAIIVALAFGGDDQTTDTLAAETALIPTSGTVREVSSAVVAGVALPPFDGTLAQDPAVGQKAPTITASHFDDTEITIDFSDGQPRAVMFFAHWCPHCQSEVKTLVERFEADGIRSDVEIVAISTNVDEGAPNYPPSRWLINERWPTPVLRDSAGSDLAAGFGLTGYPFMAVIDGDGNVVARQSGSVPQDQLDALLDLALSR